VVGPSGSGKSTLLGLIAGAEIPTSGRIDRAGVERIGWVFQNPHGVSGRTALDHVVLPLIAAGLPRPYAEREARILLTRFGLAAREDSRFASLSGGEAQRLMLARAIASRPDLLLVDEPTAQLDPANAATVVDALGALADEGAVVVVATHDPRIREACDVVIDLLDLTRRGR
jgi:ABC-type lipoprotein export system ATPase subunit